MLREKEHMANTANIEIDSNKQGTAEQKIDTEKIKVWYYRYRLDFRSTHGKSFENARH